MIKNYVVSPFEDFKIVVRIFKISSQSVIKEFANFFSRSSLSINNLSQYLVSLASLYETCILLIKSFLDEPPTASSIFAQTDVPLLRIWEHNPLSIFFFFKCRYSFTIRNPNLYDLSNIRFSCFNELLIIHF